MNNQTNTTKALAKVLSLSLLILCPIYLVLSITYSIFYSDIVFSIGILPKVLTILVVLCDIVSYAVCFSIFIYSVYRRGFKSTLPLIGLYGGIVLLKYLATVLLHTLIFRYSPDFFSAIVSWILDILVLAAALFIITVSISKRQENAVDFSGIFSKENPLQITSLFIGIFISAIKLIQRILFDIGYGAPDDILEVLWMSVSYLSDILICFIVYIVCNFTIKRIYNKNL